ncbi:MAG TPA: rod-binding protein [Rhizomicrobium sp.]|jgi:Rod binding domain-containing protein|nr:rod-binding protein [Rhizomicrobium sp.]
MTTSPDIQNAMSLARQTPVPTLQAGATPEATKKAAKEFESVFISQFLSGMFEGVKTDETFGGGQGEDMFRSMMLDQYGKSIASQGGFGIADSIVKSLTIHQQAQQRARDEATAKAQGQDTTPKSEGFPTQKPQQAFTAHPAANTGIAVTPKTAPIFAAHPATAFAVSAAASATGKRQ